MNNFSISKLKIGRPDYELTDNEKDCYDLLDKLKIDYERVDFINSPQTDEDLLKIDEAIEVKGCKNLIFQNRNKSETYLIIVPREKKLDKKLFASTYGTTRIAMVEDSVLKDLLNTHPGAVSITELMYDKENKVKLFIDPKILEQKYFRFHPNENRALLRIKTSDLKEKLIPKLKREYIILNLDEVKEV